jgi:putative ABC transport system permease protein
LPYEVEHAALVCVIGMDIKNKFFNGIDPIDKVLKIKEIPLRIVGIEEKRGSFLGQSLDNHVYIPISTYGHMFNRKQSVQIHGNTANREEFQAAIDDARVSLRNYHKLKSNQKDNFGLVNVEQLNSEIDQFTSGIAGVAIPITFISLVVGAIVIMNIMLVSVTERTFEIGLRKALGANRKQILLQFLIESSLLSSFGGIFGLLVAAGIAALIKSATSIPMAVTPFYMVLSIVVSIGVGLVSGIYPAYRAAKLDPIKALMKN